MKYRTEICRLRVIAIMAALAFIACGCKKSARETAEENAINRHQQEVSGGKQKFTNWALTKLPSTQLTTEAMRFLTGLNTNGELPGADKNTMLMSAIGRDIPSNYPVSRTVDQYLHSGFVNHYVVTKDAPDSQWQLQRAWQTDASRKVVKEFPVR